MTETIYRPGGVGAMMDEYERAARELAYLVEGVSDDEYDVIRDPHTDNPDCHSIRTIMTHVVRATYSYAEYLRVALGLPGERPAAPPEDRLSTLAGFEAA